MKQYQYILIRISGSGRETLTHNPAGWNELGITYMRHEVYHSVLRSFTLSLRFPNITGGGYDFINETYKVYGIYSEIAITISERNPNTNAYDLLYTGVLDFSPEKFTIERDFIEIAIMDSSNLQRFISRDENEIDLFTTKSMDGATITPPTKRTVTLQPVNIITKSQATCLHDHDVEMPTIPNKYTWYLHDPSYFVNQISGVSIVGASIIYTNEATIAVSISFLMNITFDYVISSQTGNWNIIAKCTLTHYNSANAVQSSTKSIMIQTSQEGVYVYQATGSTSLSNRSLTMQPGDYLTIAFNITSNLIYGDRVEIDDSYTVYLKETTPGAAASDSYAILPGDAIDAALRIMDTGAVLNSSILDTAGAMGLDMIMNGFMIRNYPNPKLSVKFKDLFKTLDATGNLGLWYDKGAGKIIIEEKAYFYNTNLIYDLGEVTNFKRSPLSQAYYSKVDAGYDNDGDYERVQGASEFAVSREYSTASKIKETKDIKAKYRYDSVGIEDLRNKQYMDLANEDDNSDSDVFIVRCEPLGGKYIPVTPSEIEFPYDAKGYDVFSSYYNLMLTPRQNAVRWGNVLKACHYKNTNPIKAQKTSKEFELEMGADYVDENSDIALSEMATALFIPELYTFDGYINRTILAAIEANPNGMLTFSYDGVQYAGFIDKVETKSYNKKANYQLIACEIPPFNFIFEENIDASYIFEENVNANKTFE